MDTKKLIDELIRDEDAAHKPGHRFFPFRDTVGKLTIGYGRNLDDVGISEHEAVVLLQHDIDRTTARLDEVFPWWQNLSEVRQRALANMAFNLGVTGLAKFKCFLWALESGRYAEATKHMLDSLWATQVKDRAKRLVTMILEG